MPRPPELIRLPDLFEALIVFHGVWDDAFEDLLHLLEGGMVVRSADGKDVSSALLGVLKHEDEKARAGDPKLAVRWAAANRLPKRKRELAIRRLLRLDVERTVNPNPKRAWCFHELAWALNNIEAWERLTVQEIPCTELQVARGDFELAWAKLGENVYCWPRFELFPLFSSSPDHFERHEVSRLARPDQTPPDKNRAAQGGRDPKYNTALQKAINQIAVCLRQGGNPITPAHIKEWFKERNATSSPSGEPFSFEPPLPNCDELYIDGPKLVWKDRHGQENDMAFRSLERYLVRAKSTLP